MSRDGAAKTSKSEAVSTQPVAAYTNQDASASLVRATRTVALLTLMAAPLAWFLRGPQSAFLLLVGAAISASGLWEWKRLMAALMARMDAHDAMQAGTARVAAPASSIGFAVAGFAVRLAVVVTVLYVSLKYLHGSVLALAAGLAMGVIALTVEGLRMLRTGTI